MTPLLWYVLLGGGLQQFLDGDIFGGLLYPVTSVLHEWTFAIGSGMIFLMLYFKAQNVVMPLVVFLLLMPLVLWIIPVAAWAITGVLVMLSIVTVFARLYLNRGN